MKFFTDECFMYKANALLEAFDRENQMIPLLDVFPPGTKDVVWIPQVAAWAEKPIVICGDGRILRNKVERETLRGAGLKFVCLASGWTNLDWPTFAWKLIKVWPAIVLTSQLALRPTVFEVSCQTLKVEKSYELTAPMPRRPDNTPVTTVPA